MSLNSFFGILASIFTVLAFSSYFKDVIYTNNKPHIMSWLGWSFVTSLGFVAMLSEGFNWGGLIVGVNSILCFSIVIISLVKKKYVWTTGLYDYGLFISGILGVILWQVFQNPNIAITFAVIGDLSFGLPTLIKIYKKPETETLFPWLMFAMAGIFGVLSVNYISYGQIIYPVYLGIYDVSGFLLLFFMTKTDYIKHKKMVKLPKMRG